MTLFSKLRQLHAQHKLAKLVENNKRAPATQEFVRRRQAMLKHTRGVA